MDSLCFQVSHPLQARSPPLNQSLFFAPPISPLSSSSSFLFIKSPKYYTLTARAKRDNSKQEAAPTAAADKGKSPATAKEEDEEYEEVEIPWLQEKAETLYENVGVAVNAIPGPRVGSTSLPWLLAAPIGYLGITFVIAVVKTVLKYSSPKAKRRRRVDQNLFLCTSIDEVFASSRSDLDSKELNSLKSKTGFTTHEILRKYIRYALNEKPFDPDLVANLIHLRKISELDNSEIVDVLSDVSQRIVKEKGPVLMDTRGMTEKGVKKKAAVQALFSKLLYLSELDEFCQVTSGGSLRVKEIFGVTDSDADSIRIETLSEVGDVESLEKMVPPDDTTHD
ncbi:hypothetical protein GOP47_0011552 [Adiantum capillus-veneris]|uniref:Armadillo-like repeats domain-containing protein n=1 Tax=Adiantum capillus-veneris TaxID=13818 RepID=A0A9D4ZFI2_ADICA|nr:hypothetical protein GOP47_0011552 [Adiantum capillus-veneris]